MTRLKCGGFVVGFHTCHSIADGFGMIQIIKSITDLAHSEDLPIILPVWERELLMARVPPRITHFNPAYHSFINGSGDDASNDVMMSTPPKDMVNRYFFFGPREIAALRIHVPVHLARSSSTFELLTAVTWRCRTIALGYEARQKVRLVFTLNARGRWKSSRPIPPGYFGNALFDPVVECSVDELCARPLEHTVELVHNAKIDMSEEHMKSMVDAMSLLRGKPPLVMDKTYVVSDIRWIGEDTLDFGWAERVGGGIPEAGDVESKVISEHMRCKNADGEDTIVVRMYLPRSAMDRFAKEIALFVNKYE